MQGVPDTVPEGGVAPPPLDSAWAESTRKKALLKLEKLDTDLKNYKGNSIKESIRYYIIRIVFLFSNTDLTHICKNSSRLFGFRDLNAGFTLDVELPQTAVKAFLFRCPCCNIHTRCKVTQMAAIGTHLVAIVSASGLFCVQAASDCLARQEVKQRKTEGIQAIFIIKQFSKSKLRLTPPLYYLRAFI